jgi:hypothetical protein
LGRTRKSPDPAPAQQISTAPVDPFVCEWRECRRATDRSFSGKAKPPTPASSSNCIPARSSEARDLSVFPKNRLMASSYS